MSVFFDNNSLGGKLIVRKSSIFLIILLCGLQHFPLAVFAANAHDHNWSEPYTVQSGDGLWTIAKNINTYNTNSIVSLVVTFLETNPQAFISLCNYRNLQVGKKLYAPEISKVIAIDRLKSTQLLAKQTQQWQAFRKQREPINCNTLPLDEELEGTTLQEKTEKNAHTFSIFNKLSLTSQQQVTEPVLGIVDPAPLLSITTTPQQPAAPPLFVAGTSATKVISPQIALPAQQFSPSVAVLHKLPTPHLASFRVKLLAILTLLFLISVFTLKEWIAQRITANIKPESTQASTPESDTDLSHLGFLSETSLSNYHEVDSLQAMQGKFTNAMVIKIAGIILLVLVAAQGFNSSLSIASFEKLYINALISSYQAVGHDLQRNIENSMLFGKPLEKFVGMNELFNDLKKNNSDISNITVSLPNRKILYSLVPNTIGKSLPEELLFHFDNVGKKNTSYQKIGDYYHISLPIQNRDKKLKGIINLSFQQNLVNARVNGIIIDNLTMLGITISIAAGLLIIGLYSLLVVKRFRLNKRRLYLFIFIILGCAQLFYSSYNIEFFKNNYLDVTHNKILTLSKILQADLNYFLSKNVKINRLLKVDELMGKITTETSEIASMQISDIAHKTLYLADQTGFRNLQTSPQTPPRLALSAQGNSLYQIVLPLSDEDRQLGYLSVQISQPIVQQKIQEIILDSVTVVIISFLFLTELMIFLLIFINRQIINLQSQHATPPAHEDIYRVARPATFVYIFSAMLCYSFLPLYMEQIYHPLFGLAKNFVLGLPVSSEIFLAGLTLIPAGIVVDKKGWHQGFLLGIVLSLLGTVLSGIAQGPLEFIIYRGIVGIGYAFCWMSLQGFVINSTHEHNRAQGITYLIAAVFSGTICGSAIGGMLAQHVGFASVFFIAAIIMLCSLLFIIVFMRQYAVTPDTAKTTDNDFDWNDLWRFLTDRNVVIMFSCSLIPFSVAMVGIMYYAGPIYLSQIGTSQSNIGRVIMVFGLCVIYLAPAMSHFIDKSPDKKHYISLSGVVGALGLVIFQLHLGFWNVFLAILLLGISSSLGASSRNIFMLNLPISKTFGVTKVMGIYRSVDKLGQTLGPILLGTLAVILGGIEAAIVASGVIYLLLTLIFIFSVPKENS